MLARPCSKRPNGFKRRAKVVVAAALLSNKRGDAAADANKPSTHSPLVLRGIFGEARNTLMPSRVDCDIDDQASKHKRIPHAIRHSCHNMLVRRRVVEVWQEILVGGQTDTRGSSCDQYEVETGRARSGSAPPHLVSHVSSEICAQHDEALCAELLDSVPPMPQKINELTRFDLDPKMFAAGMSCTMQTPSTACPTPRASMPSTPSDQSSILGSSPRSSWNNSDHTFSVLSVEMPSQLTGMDAASLGPHLETEDADNLHRTKEMHVLSPSPDAESENADDMIRPNESHVPSPPPIAGLSHCVRSPLSRREMVSTTHAEHSEIDEVFHAESTCEPRVSASPSLEDLSDMKQKASMLAQPSVVQLTMIPDGWSDCKKGEKWRPDSPRTPGGWPQRLPPLDSPTKSNNASVPHGMIEEKNRFWLPQATIYYEGNVAPMVRGPDLRSASLRPARRGAFHGNANRCSGQTYARAGRYNQLTCEDRMF